MLYLHTSNRLEQLAHQFALITREPLKQVFLPEKVIVQNSGMSRWLSLQVAKLCGISANMETLFPAEFMWQLLHLVIPDLPDQDPCAPQVLRWRLMQLLLEDSEDFPEVSHYFKDSGLQTHQENDTVPTPQTANTVAAWDLACELSRVLDQYLFYRDDWIRDWEKNENQSDAITDDWQARLWQKAVSDNHLTHWLALQDRFVDAIHNNEPVSLAKNNFPERVSFFSLSALSPGYLRLLGELAKIIDVHLFVINPCREFWSDIESEKRITRRDFAHQAYYESGNPLLASMGRQGRDFLDQLLDLPAVEEHTCFVENDEPSSVLQHLQQDILNLHHYQKRDIKADTSILFHACHTPMREVEVLHDQLLDIIQSSTDAGDAISPADMVVMTPDIEQYAPYIEAVFSSSFSSSSTASSTALPYRIADRNPADSHALIESLLKTLDLVDSRYDVESVFELLDYAAVRDSYDLQEADVLQCRDWARATNIRWGISAKKRAQSGFPGTAEHTWQYALQRMLLGYALPGERLFEAGPGHSAQANDLPILPFNEIEGSQALMLASFIRFCDVIFSLADWSEQELPLTEWLQRIKRLIKDLFAENNLSEHLYNVLDTLDQQCHCAEFELSIPFSMLRKILKKELQSVAGPENYLGYGITFCALVPMRSVPFKVVALLGMNEGEFPRQNRLFSFDRMAEQPRKGDRSRRDEERYLFLESVLAAREKLIISYVGQNVQDNSQLPPSIMVSELLDNLAGYTDQPPEKWVLKHPLQAFSPRYFEKSNDLFSYEKQYVGVHHSNNCKRLSSRSFIEKRLPELNDAFKLVSLNNLIGFYQGPARTFLNERFSISSFDKESGLPVREPFALESFVDRKIREQILSEYEQWQSQDRAEPAIDESLLICRAKGWLPHGAIGDEIVSEHRQIVKHFIDRIPDWLAKENLSFSLALGDFSLSGEITHLTESGRVVQQPAQPSFRDAIDFWINHLVLNSLDVSNRESHSYFYSPEQQFRLLPVQDASKLLQQMLDYYWQGLHFPLLFFPKSAFSLYQKNGEKGPISVALKSWNYSYYGTAQKDKFENWLLYREYDPATELFGEEFAVLSEMLFGQMFQLMEDI